MKKHALVLLIALILPAGAAHADTTAPTNGQIRQQIIHDSIAAYQASGHPCACPFNTTANGTECGSRSAYSKPGGHAPLCYAKDVSAKMVADWKSQHQQQ
jgi:hypothetical protein